MLINTSIHRRIKEKESGSITVEAAFVMPIVIFTVFALIYLAFYLHDYCRIQGLMDKILHKAAITVKHEADIATGQVFYEAINDRGVFYLITGSSKEGEAQINKFINQELSGGLFISKIKSTEVNAGKLDVSVAIEAEAEVTLPYFLKLLDRFTTMKIKSSCPIHNPAETIRCAEVILDTGSDIKGIEDIKDKLKSFMRSQ